MGGYRGLFGWEIDADWVKNLVDRHRQELGRGLESQFKMELIPGMGHSMIGLIAYSQKAIINSTK
jgi:hypothetical protein